jgi:hypothetical protein
MQNTKSNDKFGVYLFGSHFNGDSMPESDVDLMIFVHPDLPMHRFLTIQDEVSKRHPEWKNQKFDMQIVLCQEDVPQKVHDATAYALAQQGAQLIHGQDVARQCYQMTWDDYWKAMKFEARKRIQQTNAKNLESLGAHFRSAMNLKFLLSMSFTVQACLEMRTQPGNWILSPTEIKSEQFHHMHQTVRKNWRYQLPQSPEDQELLNAYFQYSMGNVATFMKNWG